MSTKKLLEALSLLEDKDEHFTESGKPRIEVVEKLSGLNTNREELEKIAPEFTRKNPVVPVAPPEADSENPPQTDDANGDELEDLTEQKAEAQETLDAAKKALDTAKSDYLEAVTQMRAVRAKETALASEQNHASTVNAFQKSQAKIRESKIVQAKELSDLIIKQQIK